MADSDRSILAPGEPHPATAIAKKIIHEVPDLFVLLESLSSCAIEGNRMAEVCAGTLDRLLKEKTVSDRYYMGLALMILEMKKGKDES